MTSPAEKLARVSQLQNDLAGIAQAARDPAESSIAAASGSMSYGSMSYGSMSYGMEWFTSPEQALKDINAGVQKLMGLLAPTTTVQTAGNGAVAISRVQYRSEAASVFSSNLSAGVAADHIDRVQQTLAFRSAVVGAVAAAGGAMVGVSAAVSNPLAIGYAAGLLFHLKDRIELLVATVGEVG